ncbi:hypothetical protein HY090_00345, partial [Candidatus Kaiserbacteria bacterium]|nr:hypothetical protein [Candidatus Kaiserbacteria bacterium]
MGYSSLHFFNIEYWYCVIISLFGSKCTDTELIASGLGTTTPSGSFGGATPRLGFWEWLFGIRSGAGDAGSSGAAHGGVFGPIFAFIGGVFGVLWGIYSVLAYMASFLLFLLIIGSLAGIILIRMRDEERYGNLPLAAEKLHPLRGRWQMLLDHSMSSDPARWRDA